MCSQDRKIQESSCGFEANMSGNYFEAESHVDTYNKFRPTPPKNMIEEIIRFTREKISGPLEMAVDVGCGSGQSTEVFAPFFNKVLGVDSSYSIIREAKAKCIHSNVIYSQATAEKIPVSKGSVNLISVCQSLHWFNIPKFYEEADRILCKNGVFAVYGYQLPVPIIDGAEEDLLTLVRKYYEDVLGEYVLAESRKVYLDNYRSNEFNEVQFIDGGRMQRVDNFISEVEGNLNDIIGYISSWSTYQNYTKQVGEEKADNLLLNFKSDFIALLNENTNPFSTFKIRYNYFLLIGRKI